MSKEEAPPVVVSREDFIRAWQSSTSTAQVVEKTGLSVSQVRSRGAGFRRMGVPLKRYPNLLHSNPTDWSRLAALARELLPPGAEVCVHDPAQQERSKVSEEAPVPDGFPEEENGEFAILPGLSLPELFVENGSQYTQTGKCHWCGAGPGTRHSENCTLDPDAPIPALPLSVR